MAAKKQKLELTWIGKENRPRLEPRILLEDPELSLCADRKVTEDDIFDNILVQGDNLLALKALEAEYAGKVKCVFIDPPYNTGHAFEHYDDGVEHSLWLSLMRERLEVLRRLLSDDGSLWITIDDNEGHYLKVLCDEVFGRSCFVANVIWRSTDNSNNDAKQFSTDHNTVLVYSSTPDWRSNRQKPTTTQRRHFKNPDNDPRGPWFDGNPLSSPNPRPNLEYEVVSPTGHRIPYPTNGWRWSKERMAKMIESGEIRFTPDGKALRRRTYLADMKGIPPSTLWYDLDDTGHNRQAKYEQKKLFPGRTKQELFGTPKPERLIKKVLEISTHKGDLVLDSFLGSGTTAAVCHKMGRRWIGVELGDHAESHCVPRLQKVVEGGDLGGITDAVGWKGGGGFRFYRLAPSLLEKDAWGNWIISDSFRNAPDAGARLAEAMCKLEGFRYNPSQTVYWQHGQSTEQDYIYVTTQTLTHEQLQAISEDVGEERSLLICCSAFRAKTEQFPNLTVKKIPAAVLARCEWGKDDYSLNVESVMSQEVAPTAPDKPGGKKKANAQELPLFAPRGDK